MTDEPLIESGSPAVAQQQADDPTPHSSFGHFLWERTDAMLRLSTVIFLDGLIFVWWLFVAWMCHVAADWASQHGVNEAFAHGFTYISSTAIIVLALIYFCADIRSEYLRLFRKPK